MIIKKRIGVFETNSSAMHSIVVTAKDEHYSQEEKERRFHIFDGTLRFYRCSDLEFGRSPFRVLATFYDKLRYTIPSFFSKYNGMSYEEENNPLYNDPRWNELMTILNNHFKEFEAIELPENDWLKNKETDEYQMYFGDIETDLALLERFLKEENISLEEFLTNRKYIIIVDGDEYCIFETLKEELEINPVKEFE